MKPLHHAVAGVALLALPAGAQTNGLPGDGTLAHLLDSIRAAADLPAMAGMLILGDSILEIAAAGVRANGHDDAVTVDDRWHIGSNTKAMTATLAGILVERGEIEWTTTVTEVFPELRDSIRPELTDVTLAELLGHTAGVSNDILQTTSWGTVRTSSASLREQRRAWVPELLSLTPTARGTFGYSNSGYIVAGAMIERVTDTAWEDLMRREIFEPLEMETAGFGAPGTADSIDQPRGHRYLGERFSPLEPGPFADNPAALGPAGTVHASLTDYAKFVMAHLAGAQGTAGIVSAATFTTLHTAPTGERGYGLGWGVVNRPWAGGATLTHSGSNTLWFHTVWVAPNRNFAVVAATNAAGPNAPRAVDQAISAMVARLTTWLEVTTPEGK